MTDPVLVLIAKKGCGGCKYFAPDDEDKVEQGYQLGQLSEWERVINDPSVGSRFWSREFRTGLMNDGVRVTIPDQFSFVQYVPRLIIVRGSAYNAAFDLHTHEVRNTNVFNANDYREYGGAMNADSIKQWLNQNYNEMRG
jgi:hypothetical protein